MTKTARLLPCALALTLLAACGQPAVPPTPEATVPAPAPTATAQPATYDIPHMTRDTLPRLDGSTSTAPLGRALCAVLLGEDVDQVHDLVRFSKTTASYRALMEGNADLLIAAEPAPTVVEEREAAGFEWEMAPIATDALVFLVNADNPVEGLTTEQVRKIYTGQITNWKQVGGEDREILPFQRNAEAGSQTLMKKLVMGDVALMEAPMGYTVSSMEGLIQAVRSFDGSPGAIGYTVYYYANDMNMADGLKVVPIDGAAPDAESIRSGAYPFTNPYYTVIAADAPADGPARRIFDWLQGPVGQSLIRHEGYVSVLAEPAPVDWALELPQAPREVYTRLSPEWMDTLVPSGDYGLLLPFQGAVDPGESAFGGDYGLSRYGLVTRQGMIVVDPVYDSVWPLRYFDENGAPTPTDLYALSRVLPADTEDGFAERYALAALDGSWATGFDYLYVGAVDATHVWAVEENGDGVMLDRGRTELWRLTLPEGAGTWTYRGGDGGMWWSGGYGTWYDHNDDTQHFVDIDGVVHSNTGKGWSSMQSFSCGLAQAMESEHYDTWGYLNTDGEWAIPPAYSSARDFQDGKAIVGLSDGRVQVIDTAGKVLWESDHGELSYRTGDGFSYFCHYQTAEDRSYDSVYACYDNHLNEIDFGVTGKRVQWAGDDWFYENTGDGLRLYSPAETVQLPYSGALGAVSGGVAVVSGDAGELAAYGLDGREIIAPAVRDYLGFLTDERTGLDYLCVQIGRRYEIYDLAGQLLARTYGYYPSLSDGLLTYQTDSAYGYMDLKGNMVFCVWLMKSQGD